MLFHYCSSTTFLNIVETKELWASDLSKMNDPDEVHRGAEIISELFSRVFPEAEDRLDSASLIYLACSFSQRGDLLSQWRAYGDDGTGFSVGVERQALEIANSEPGQGVAQTDSPQPGAPGFRVSDVFYGEQEFTAHYLELMRNYRKEHGTPFVGPSGAINLNELAFIKELAEASCLIKSDFYEDELEVRVFNAISPDEAKRLSKSSVVRDMVDVRFRATRFGIKSYTPVKLVGNGTSSLRKVVIGPNNESSIDDVKLVLTLNHFDGVEVVKSRGNYR